MESIQGKFAYICLFQQILINATKFGNLQIHFKSDVFATVAITAAKSPYCVSWAAVNEMNASKEISLKQLKCNIRDGSLFMRMTGSGKK